MHATAGITGIPTTRRHPDAESKWCSRPFRSREIHSSCTAFICATKWPLECKCMQQCLLNIKLELLTVHITYQHSFHLQISPCVRSDHFLADNREVAGEDMPILLCYHRTYQCSSECLSTPYWPWLLERSHSGAGKEHGKGILLAVRWVGGFSWRQTGKVFPPFCLERLYSQVRIES
jgi:hypothetical protein